MEPVDYRRAMEILAADGLEFVRPEEGVVLAWSRDGKRLIWTSPAGAYLRPFLTIGPGGRTDPALPIEDRLRALGARLSPSQGLRMERLRLSAGRAPAVTCACRLVEADGEVLLLTAIVGPIPSLPTPARSPGEECASEAKAATQPAPAIAPALIAAEPVEPERGIETRLQALREGGRQRFVWQADAKGRFTFVSDTLADVVGTANADILGRGWDEIAGKVVADPSGAVSGLFARHETWSGREVLWRIGESDFAVPVDLAGIPAVGANREILGFRGFGVCRTDAIRELGNAPSAPETEPDSASYPAPASDPVLETASEPVTGPVPDKERLSSEKPRDTFSPDLVETAGIDARPEFPSPTSGPAVASPPASAVRRSKQAHPTDGFGHLAAPVRARIGLPRPTPLRDPARRVEPENGSPVSLKTERPAQRREEGGRLSSAERQAFRDIARALSMGLEPAPSVETVSPSNEKRSSTPELPTASEAGASSPGLRELTAMLDTVSDGIIVLDGAARIVSLNRSGEALFGLDQAEVAGERLTTLFAPDSHAAVLDYVAGLGRSGVGGVLNDGRDLVGRVREGGTFPLSMTIGRIGGETDQRFCAVLRDVTASKLMERELVAAREAADESANRNADLLAKISHEIRTPLNTVLGFSEIMREERFGPLGNERYREYIRDVHEAAGQVFALVNKLLDLARIEAGRMELTFTGVSLNEVVTACVGSLQAQATRARIVLRTSFASQLPPVVADQRAVREIMLNLLSNALAFTPAGGQVIVSTALSDRGELVFRVRDTGIGMTREEIEAALKPFRKVSPRGGGAGLGLPLTKALVEANRGELQISSAPREGTLVEVLFPSSRVLTH